MGIILFIIATVLCVILTPINWVLVTIKYGISNCYFFETAVDIEKFDNHNFRTFLNATMKIKGSYMFDNVNEPIINQFKFVTNE
jgi:hypothetical protein